MFKRAAKKTAERRDIAAEVTQKLLELMEKHGTDWVRPWNGAGRNRNFVTGNAYRGANVFITGMAGFSSPFFGSYAQWTAAGAQVTKGSKATHVILYRAIDIRDKESDEEKTMKLLKTFPVFNEDQTTGGPKLEINKPTEIERHEICERVIAAAGATITILATKPTTCRAPTRSDCRNPSSSKAANPFTEF